MAPQLSLSFPYVRGYKDPVFSFALVSRVYMYSIVRRLSPVPFPVLFPLLFPPLPPFFSALCLVLSIKLCAWDGFPNL